MYVGVATPTYTYPRDLDVDIQRIGVYHIDVGIYHIDVDMCHDRCSYT